MLVGEAGDGIGMLEEFRLFQCMGEGPFHCNPEGFLECESGANATSISSHDAKTLGEPLLQDLDPGPCDACASMVVLVGLLSLPHAHLVLCVGFGWHLWWFG